MKTEVRGYCATCSCWCPIVSQVTDGRFAGVKPDEEHPLACGVCVKALAAPELVYSEQRLRYPMKRTAPKGAANPGWKRISWEEALETTAARLLETRAKYGAESVILTRSGPAGSPMAEIAQWVIRLGNAFGSPNNVATGHICQWHRDICSNYTWGGIGGRGALGRPDFERSRCILIWGNNTHATRHSLVKLIMSGVEQGAKLIVIDPRKTRIASMADIWLQVYPGTDGALALSMINVLIEEDLFDHSFVRDWTNAPFLVRGDTGDLLRAKELPGGGPDGWVMLDSATGEPKSYMPDSSPAFVPLLDATCAVKLTDGRTVQGKTVFRLLRELADAYEPSRAERITGVPRDRIREAARMFATVRPACWYSWNGIEQSINASQTNRTANILYALTGNYDMPGGNLVLPRLSMNPIDGNQFLTPEIDAKRLGYAERPLGASGNNGRTTQAYEVYRAILTGKPYPVKAVLGFGGNILLSNAPSVTGRDALAKLDFHVQTEFFLSPTAELADIVLPAATSWESWHVGVNVGSPPDKAYIQIRPAVVTPQHESRPDMEVIFELAKRLGLGDRFWGGDVEAGFNHQLAPLGITVDQLRKNPGGMVVNLPLKYQKYRSQDSAGKSVGFATPSKRVNVFVQLFKEHGYAPLPVWKEPGVFRFRPKLSDYPLVLGSGKVIEYCHSQHRGVPSLRRAVPDPFLEIHPSKAAEMGIGDGEWVRLETPHGAVTLRARLTDTTLPDVVGMLNGWWQACPELGLPGYDAFASTGANMNVLFSVDEKDTLSGCLPLKEYPCRIVRI